nr:hypothetical protein [Tanacetum cinerariifolium]
LHFVLDCVLSWTAFCPGLRFVKHCVLLKPNGEALRKCILSGPYKPTTVLVQAVEATNDSPAIPKHATEMWEAIERLQQGESLNIQDVKTNLFWEFARNANPLVLVATAQANQDPYYQTSRSHRSQAPSSKPSIPTRSQTTTRHKGKEIAKPITPPSEKASKEDSDPEQTQRDKDMQKNLDLIAKYVKKIYKPTYNNLRTSSDSKNKNVDTTPRFKNDNHSRQFRNQRTVNVVGARENIGSLVVQQSGIQCFNCKEFRHFSKECRKPKRVKDFAYHKEKMLLCKQAEQGVPLQAEHNICLVETNDSNVTHDSPDMCEDAIQNDQNDVESDDERCVLANLIANLIANLKLNVDENKKIQKQLKKANTIFAQELKECKAILAETTRNVDLKYVESLEKEINELESDKAEFSDMYDVILQECVSNDVKCSYLQSLFDLDALAELQCKNDTVWNEKASNVFRKERELYIEIQDLKAQLQDKNISISELKKLIEKGKGKSVNTKFDKPFVVRQPNAQRIPKLSVLGKPAPFSNSLERIYFPNTKSVPKDNVSEGLSKPVTAHTLPQTAKKAVSNTNVLKPGKYRIDNRSTQTRAPQLPQTVRNTNPRVSTSTGVNHKPNASRPQLKSDLSRDKSEIPCLYAFPYDQSTHAIRLIPDGEETLALEREKIFDNAWIKHSKDQFRTPTAQDMEILIQTCLMPLAIKTQNDSFKFVHELKQEMHADLKYVESLEKEINELESDKAEYSDMYDVILQECVSNDVKCSYLQSLFDLDALAELQCMYLHKVKECDCLAQKLSNQTKSVSKKVHTELLQRFVELEKHSVSLEIALQKCKEQIAFCLQEDLAFCLQEDLAFCL